MQKKMLFQFIETRENHFQDCTKSFAWGYKGKKCKLLLPTFRNNNTPSRKTINKLLKIYPDDLFNFDYLEQYQAFDNE